MEKLDEEFLKILNSDCENQDFVTYIHYLLNAKVLTVVEELVCNEVLGQLEILSKKNLNTVLACSGIDINDQDITGYEKLELMEKIDDFILKRKNERNEEALSSALILSKHNVFSKEATNLFFNRYVDVINIKESNTFKNLEYIQDFKEEFGISTANEFIDNFIGGLNFGTLTTIVGDKNLYKSLWAINIAYKAIESDKNVLYLSLGTSEKTLYKRLLTRHSCNEKFEKPINVGELNTEYDENLYKMIYYDFTNNYLDRLVVFDESQFYISTQLNLQKLIASAQKTFIDRKGTGIDLIIIDDFTFMKLDIGRRSISNRNTIINEYYKYLKKQARDLLGTGKSIPIVTTICDNDGGLNAGFNDGNYVLEFVLDEVKLSSDNILTIFGDESLNVQNILKLQVIKSNDKVMEEAKGVEADYQYWYLKYSLEPITNTKILLTSQAQEIDKLEKKNESLTDSLNRMFDLTNKSVNDNSSKGSTLDKTLDLELKF